MGKSRPSEILNVFDQWAAFCVDQIVISFGVMIENRLSETDKHGKPKYKLENLLEPPMTEKDAVKRFASMMGIKVLDEGKKKQNGTQLR